MRRSSNLRAFAGTAAFCCFAAAGPARAQTCFEAALYARVETDGVHLDISLSSAVWVPHCWNSRPAGVDIYRRTLGGECGTAVRITEEPIPWVELAAGHADVDAQIVDTGTTLGKGYRYTARAVDADRNPIAENAEVTVGEVTRGLSLIGHGTLVREDGGPGYLSLPRLWSCPEECSSIGFVLTCPPSVAAYFNTNTPLAIYGEVLGQEYVSNTLETVLRIESVQEQRCIVGVQPTTWGGAKRLYR